MRRYLLITSFVVGIVVLLFLVGSDRSTMRHAAKDWVKNVQQSVSGKNIMPGGGGYYAPAPATDRTAAAPRFNTEAYDRIVDNGFKQASLAPLSTFSIDVDTASYANTRRFIDQGSRPPADAVRIEELINYFTYEYPDPANAAPFSITAEVGPCPWRPKHRLALIGLQGRRADKAAIPPRNLVFLIDVSGSMDEPNKLPLVRAALGLLTDQLTERDRVAIVVYAGASGLVLPSTSGAGKDDIRRAIDRLESGGSTNGGEGLRLAYSVVHEHFITGGVNRVVLATDGDFNVGVTSEGELLRLVEQERERGVALSVLGFGMGNYKDSTLEKLADHGDGNYAYIDSLQEAEKTLVADASGTLVTIAKDVKLQVEFNPRIVAAYRLIGYENRVLQHEDFNNDRRDAGDLGVGHSVTALYEIVPAGLTVDGGSVDPLKYQESRQLSAAADARELMTVKLRYKQPEATESQLLSVVVADEASESLSANLGFAAAVAEFGLLLRDSEHKGAASWTGVLERARQFRGADARGMRGEFIRLVETASRISRPTTDAPGAPGAPDAPAGGR
jgi:Ca-activated chloride channel family protein